MFERMEIDGNSYEVLVELSYIKLFEQIITMMVTAGKLGWKLPPVKEPL